jgi:hypothetical protein
MTKRPASYCPDYPRCKSGPPSVPRLLTDAELAAIKAQIAQAGLSELPKLEIDQAFYVCGYCGGLGSVLETIR